MLHFPYRAFDGCPVVLAFLLTLLHLTPSLGYRYLGVTKGQTEGRALLPRSGRAVLVKIKRASLAELGIKVRPVTQFVAAQLDWNALALGASDASGNSSLI